MANQILEQTNLPSQTKKKCSICKELKSIKEFGKRSDVKSGLHSQCNDCRSKYRKNDESYMAQYRRDRQNDKANRPFFDSVAYIRQYRQTHKKEIAIQKSQYNKTEQGQAAKEKGRLKYRVLKLSAEYEDFNPKEIFERDNYICQLCRKKTRPDFKNPYHPLYPNLDHIVPLSKGGAHTKLNTQCLCFRCNARKHNNKAGDQLRMFG